MFEIFADLMCTLAEAIHVYLNRKAKPVTEEKDK